MINVQDVEVWMRAVGSTQMHHCATIQIDEAMPLDDDDDYSAWLKAHLIKVLADWDRPDSTVTYDAIP